MMIPVIPIALGVIAGICLYAGGLHLYVGLSRPRRRRHLLFALLCLLIASNALIGISVNEAATVASYAAGAKWQLALLYLFGIAFVWFTALYTNIRPLRFLLILSGALVATLALHLASPFGILYSDISSLTALTLPWGETYVLPEATGNPWGALNALTLMAFVGFILYAGISQYRRGEEESAILLGLGMAVFLGAAVHDVLIDLELFSSIYLLGYGFLALIVIMSLGLSREVVQASRTKQDLIENEARYRTLYNNTPVMMHSIDREGRLLSVNDHWLDRLGYERSEVIGRRSVDFLTESSRQYALKEALPRFFQTGVASDIPLQMVKRNGELIEVQLSALGERDESGQINRTMSFMVDVTKRKQLEDELKNHREYLEQQVQERTAELTRVNELLQMEIAERRDAEEKITQRNRELLTLQTAGASIAASLDIRQIVDAVAEQMIELLNVDACTISDWQREANVISVMAESSPKFWYDAEASVLDYDLADYPLTKQVLVNQEAAQVTLSQPGADPAELAVMQKTGIKTLLMLPMVVKGEAICLAELADSQVERTFGNHQISVAQLLANQAAVAIQNARLFQKGQQEIAERERAEKALHQRVEELSVLNSIAHTIATVLDLSEALNIVSKDMADVFEAQATIITALDDEQTELEVLAQFQHQDLAPSMQGQFLPVTQAEYIKEALKTGQALIISDVQATDLKPAVEESLRARNIRAIMLVPLRVRGTTIGLMTVGTNQENRVFAPEEVNLAETIAGYVAGAVETSRLLAEEQRQRQVAESLREVGATVTSSLDLQTVLTTIFEQLGLVVHYDGACISLIEGEDLVLTETVGISTHYLGYRLPLASDSPLVDALQSKQARVVADTLADPGWVNWDDRHEIRSWMGAPLISGHRAIGLLTVDNTQRKAYRDEQAHILQIFANHAATAIENARLYEQAQTVAVDEERQRLARDLHDSVTQSLYSLTLLANGWGAMAEQGRLGSASESFKQLGQVGQQALKEMRLLIHQLRPPILEEVGLVGALQQRLDAVEQRVGVETRLLTRGEVDELPLIVEEQLFHIALEALNNALRHANATAITVRLQALNGHTSLSIEDNGSGFDPKSDSAGMGLVIMQERAEAVGAQVSVATEPNEGTTVKVVVSVVSDGNV